MIFIPYLVTTEGQICVYGPHAGEHDGIKQTSVTCFKINLSRAFIHNFSSVGISCVALEHPKTSICEDDCLSLLFPEHGESQPKDTLCALLRCQWLWQKVTLWCLRNEIRLFVRVDGLATSIEGPSPLQSSHIHPCTLHRQIATQLHSQMLI